MQEQVFDVLFGPGPLGMSPRLSPFGVEVVAFVKKSDGIAGACEASGKVRVGDIIIKVAGRSIKRVDFDHLKNILRDAPHPLIVTFLRRGPVAFGTPVSEQRLAAQTQLPSASFMPAVARQPEGQRVAQVRMTMAVPRFDIGVLPVHASISPSIGLPIPLKRGFDGAEPERLGAREEDDADGTKAGREALSRAHQAVSLTWTYFPSTMTIKPPAVLVSDPVLLDIVAREHVSTSSLFASPAQRRRWVVAHELRRRLEERATAISTTLEGFDKVVHDKLLSEGLGNVLGANSQLTVPSLVETLKQAEKELVHRVDELQSELRRAQVDPSAPLLDTASHVEVTVAASAVAAARSRFVNAADALDLCHMWLAHSPLSLGWAAMLCVERILELVCSLEQADDEYPDDLPVPATARPTKPLDVNMPATPGEQCLAGVHAYCSDVEHAIAALQGHLDALRRTAGRIALREDVRVSEDDIAALCANAKTQLAVDPLFAHVTVLRLAIEDALDRALFAREKELDARHGKILAILERTKAAKRQCDEVEEQADEAEHALKKLRRRLGPDDLELAKATKVLCDLQQRVQALHAQGRDDEAAVQALARNRTQSTAEETGRGEAAMRCDFPDLFFAVSRVWNNRRSFDVEDLVIRTMDEANLRSRLTLEDFDRDNVPAAMSALLPRSSLKVSGAVLKSFLGRPEDALAMDPKSSPLKVLKSYAVRRDAPEDVKLLRRALLLPRKVDSAHVLASEGVIYDAGRCQLVSVLPFCPGGNLAHWLQSSPRPWLVKLEVMRQAASALAAFHKAGVLHRDIKPANIMMTSPHDGALALVADFDEGKEVTAFATLAVTQHAALGTLGFMAPEVVAKSRAGKPADIFSFAATAVAVLVCNGAEPGTADFRALLREAEHGQPMDAHHWPALFALLDRALDDDCDARPTARELEDALSVRTCALRLACFDRAEERIMTDGGLLCASGEHFYCRDCLVDAAEGFSSSSASEFACIACERPFADDVLVRVLPLDAFVALGGARRVAVKAEAERRGAEMAKLVADIALTQRVVDRVVEGLHAEVMAFSCPRCLTSADEFEGCLSLTCANARCAARFCALCRYTPLSCTVKGHASCTCSRAVHAHCQECAFNPVRGNVYGAAPNANRCAQKAIEAARFQWRQAEMRRRLAGVGELWSAAVNSDARVAAMKMELKL